MTPVWFSLVASLLSQDFIKTKFSRIQHRLEQIFGALLIAVGIKVAFASSK
jgi:threonine/homoserine/homoserine lactone efflux protein